MDDVPVETKTNESLSTTARTAGAITKTPITQTPAAPERVEKTPETALPKTPPSELQTLRTLRSDVEASIAGGSTLVSMAAAESARRATEASLFAEKAALPVHRGRLVYLLLAGFSLLFLSGSLLMYVLLPETETENTEEIVPPDFIFTEQRRILNVGEKAGDAFIGELSAGRRETDGQLNSISALTPIETSSGKAMAVGAGAFLSRLDPEVPEELARTLAERFLLGIHIFDGNQPFLIFKTDTYESAFAGTLAWERRMPYTLGKALRSASDWAAATSTIASPEFKDVVLRNKDARVLLDARGKILLLYSFTDRRTLVITTNENTFAEVLARMATVKAP